MIVEYKEVPQGFELYFLADLDSVTSTLCNNPFSSLLCYCEKEKIVGYLLYSQMYERMEIENIKVTDTFRGQHIASYLMENLICLAEKGNVINITLEVRISNDVAIHLYEKFGFFKKAIRKNYYDSEDGILMMKSFNENSGY